MPTEPPGLAAQPLPHRPRRGRTRLPARRAARQPQCGPRLRWETAGGRCAKHSPATGSAGPRATPRRSGRPATPPLDSGVCALSPGALPARPRPAAELYQWVRREEQYAILGPTRWSSCTAIATPVGPPCGPGRSSAGPTAASGWPANPPAAPSTVRPTAPIAPAGLLTNYRSGRWRPTPADASRARQAGQRAAVPPDAVGL